MERVAIMLAQLVFLMLFVLHRLGADPINITVGNSIHDADDKFLSFALDCSLIGHHWETFRPQDLKVIRLAQGLSPAILRLGGTSCDYVVFNGTETNRPLDLEQEQLGSILRGSDWNALVQLSRISNLTLLYDANVMLRNRQNCWNSTNFKAFLSYNAKLKVSNLIFELGNEPNNYPVHFNKTITGEELARDFSVMRQVLLEDPFYNNSWIVGADVGNPYLKAGYSRLSLDPASYIYEFLKSGHSYINALTWHQYYLKGSTATVDDFVNPLIMDEFTKQVEIVNEIIQDVLGTNASFPVWMGETSSAYDSGAPNISDTYVAGFLWMDKLGVAAMSAYDVVIRQTFYGGWYSLINNELDPLPDYWLSYVYKKLVGARSLKISYTSSPFTRVYLHCSKIQVDGFTGVVLYAMNLNSTSPTALALPEIRYSKINAYVLEPRGGDLQSKEVLLNGKLLAMTSKLQLPSIIPRSVSQIVIPPMRYGFFVLNAKIPACQ